MLAGVESDPLHGGARIVDAASLRQPPLWEYAAAAGIGSLRIGLPATSPAHGAGGCIGDDYPGTCPSSGAQWRALAAGALGGFDADTAATLDGLRVDPDELDAAVLGPLIPDVATIDPHADRRPALAALALARSFSLHAAATWLLETQPAPLVLVCYPLLAELSSVFAAYLPPCPAAVPEADFLAYLEAVLRVYNALGQRDNIYKARIKILVRELKPAKFIEMIEQEFAALPADRQYLEPEIVEAIHARFVEPAFETLPARSDAYETARAADADFRHWVRTNTHPHRVPGYISAVVSLKPAGGIPGDISADEMERIADLAQTHSLSEIRVSHEQNLVLPHVRLSELYAVWQALREAGLGTSNVGLISDSIACPGMDYCSLATARSVPGPNTPS